MPSRCRAKPPPALPASPSAPTARPSLPPCPRRAEEEPREFGIWNLEFGSLASARPSRWCSVSSNGGS